MKKDGNQMPTTTSRVVFFVCDYRALQRDRQNWFDLL